MSELRKFSVERLVYDGSDPSDDWVVSSIGHTKLKVHNIKTVDISSLHEYEAGCKLHENCLGHMGKTEGNILLPIQSMSVHNINISNSVYKATEIALQNPGTFGKIKYDQILRESMKKKTGRMRKGILNCHIDGSLRMVITPQWDFPRNVIAIPDYLSDKWYVCRLDETTNRYSSMLVKDGDNAVVVRPPSLSARSIQPMVVRYWKHTCMGISPDILKAFEGDYDGDEMHVNPVYSKAAIEECKRWVNTPNKTIDNAREIYSTLKFYDSCSQEGYHMTHTTMSFKQMVESEEQPLMAEETRTKKDHIRAIRDRITNPDKVHESFDVESIRGMGDINRRYLTQPVIGDMSRIAKIVASCVSQRADGMMGIWTENGFREIMQFPVDNSEGNPTVRAISIICASAQQVALDAHRVSKDSLPSQDMISDLIVGSDYTTVVLSRREMTCLLDLDSDHVRWKYNCGNIQYVICHVSWKGLQQSNAIIAAHSPHVLRKVSSSRRVEVCSNSIRMILNYYGISLTQTEISALAVLYSYMPEAHTLPITTRDGMHARRLQWVETTMARHYTGLASTVNSKNISSSP